MNKLAIFVEGYTELQFVTNLLTEVAGKNNVAIDHQTIKGGTTVPRSVTTINAIKVSTAQKYYVLIVDCGGETQVKARILEEHENLTRSGYLKIIGLRDVRPTFTIAQIPRVLGTR